MTEQTTKSEAQEPQPARHAAPSRVRLRLKIKTDVKAGPGAEAVDVQDNGSWGQRAFAIRVADSGWRVPWADRDTSEMWLRTRAREFGSAQCAEPSPAEVNRQPEGRQDSMTRQTTKQDESRSERTPSVSPPAPAPLRLKIKTDMKAGPGVVVQDNGEWIQLVILGSSG